MMITPNLHFTGRCAEAMALYQRAFGAQVRSVLRYGEAGETEHADYVYHAELTIGGLRLVMNDYADALPTPQGNTVSIMVSMDTVAQAQAAYDALQAGARIITAPCVTGYSDFFASLVDAYGVRWELIVEK